MPGAPQGVTPVQVTPVQVTPVQVTPVQVTPIQLVTPVGAPAAGGLDLAPQPDMGWQDRSGVTSGVNPALDLVDGGADLEWQSPAGGGGLDLADEPDATTDPALDGFDPVDEDVPLTHGDEEEGGYVEEAEEPAWVAPAKKAAPAVIGLVVIGLIGVNLFSGADEEQDPRKRRRTASTQSNPDAPAKPDKPKPPPIDPEAEFSKAKEKADALAKTKDYLGALAVYDELPSVVKSGKGSELHQATKSLSEAASKLAKAEGTKLKEAGKYEEALAFLDPYFKTLTGRPRGKLVLLERELKKLVASGAKPPSPSPKPTPSRSPQPTPSARPTPTPVVRRPTPSPSPSPRRRYKRWVPQKAPSDEDLLKDVPKGKLKKTKHYIIVSTADEQFTKESAWMLESVRRGFYRFFRKKDFEAKDHDGPLVAYVFGSEEDYRRVGGKQGISVPGNAAGFYTTKTNGLYFRDSRNTPQARQVKDQLKKYEEHLAKLRKKKDKAKGQNKTRYSDFIREQAKRLRKYKRKNKKFLETANDELTIHEAVHQLCYNAGILTPSPLNPEWVVEGLAMLFEEEAVWKGRSGPGVPYRIGVLKRRAKENKRMTVRQLVASNQSLISRGDAGLAYSSAWALIHMFVRGKFQKWKQPFLTYLKGIQERSREAGWEVQGAEAAQERITRFEAAFGSIDKLESEYKAYVDKLIKK